MKNISWSLRKYAFVLMTSIVVSGPAFGQACTEYQSLTKEEAASAALGRVIKETKAVGLSVAVVKDGKIIYSGAFGYKDYDNNELLKEDNIFRIASISKSFTATAVMQLVSKGKLSLDTDVSDILGFTVRNPKYPNVVITIRRLLSHTSSLNDSEGYFDLDVANPAKSVHFFRAYNDYAPGEKYEYCNLGFNMLGAAVEKASGMRFDNYIKKNIIVPLGLYAGFNPDSLDRSRFATIFEYNAEKDAFTAQPTAYRSRAEEIVNSYVIGRTTPIFSPTGGMKISARDLARYMIMHMNYGKGENGKRIIPEKLSRQMQTWVINTGDVDFYGFALRSANNLIPGEKMVGHTGSAYGLYSAMFFEPQKRFGIVMITNGCKPEYKNGFTTVQGETIRALYDIFIK